MDHPWAWDGETHGRHRTVCESLKETDLPIEATVQEYWSHFGAEKSRTEEKHPDEEVERVILDAYQLFKSGPVILDKIMRTYNGLAIPYNSIYQVMLMYQLIIENPRKERPEKMGSRDQENRLLLSSMTHHGSLLLRDIWFSNNWGHNQSLEPGIPWIWDFSRDPDRPRYPVRFCLGSWSVPPFVQGIPR